MTPGIFREPLSCNQEHLQKDSKTSTYADLTAPQNPGLHPLQMGVALLAELTPDFRMWWFSGELPLENRARDPPLPLGMSPCPLDISRNM